ncbi:hypothetical protein Taro_050847 [Colocasia esculenta]|uniref:Uncharacterized protein n=1 Tax=Colocasia esculenta TaxID=4460 RepID=A0A843XF65_COLES|nr:hypothetical protein [Colocasia esculenta]
MPLCAAETFHLGSCPGRTSSIGGRKRWNPQGGLQPMPARSPSGGRKCHKVTDDRQVCGL